MHSHPIPLAVRAGHLARHDLAKLAASSVPAGALAASLALLAGILGWHGADTPNAIFRIDAFRAAGLVLWNAAWYGGHSTLGYSALLPVLGAALGPTLLGAACAVAAAMCADRLLRTATVATAGQRRAASALFAAGTVTNLAVGRLAFALGLALALAAILAACERHWWLAGGLSAVSYTHLTLPTIYSV